MLSVFLLTFNILFFFIFEEVKRAFFQKYEKMTELLSPEIPARVLLTSYGWLVASFDSANGVVTLEEFLNRIRGKCEKIKETEVVSALIEHSLIRISLLREPDGRFVIILYP